jgi:hypothetical protein
MTSECPLTVSTCKLWHSSALPYTWYQCHGHQQKHHICTSIIKLQFCVAEEDICTCFSLQMRSLLFPFIIPLMWMSERANHTLVAMVTALNGFFFRRVRRITKSDYQLRHVRLSVRKHVTTRLPLDGFWWNLIFKLFSKISRENSSFMKIWQE